MKYRAYKCYWCKCLKPVYVVLVKCDTNGSTGKKKIMLRKILSNIYYSIKKKCILNIAIVAIRFQVMVFRSSINL